MIMTDQADHSDHYDAILESVTHPEITFINEQPADRQAAVKQVLHNFVHHQYMDHDLTEWEAEDLHQYINERSYHNA